MHTDSFFNPLAIASTNSQIPGTNARDKCQGQIPGTRDRPCHTIQIIVWQTSRYNAKQPMGSRLDQIRL